MYWKALGIAAMVDRTRHQSDFLHSQVWKRMILCAGGIEGQDSLPPSLSVSLPLSPPPLTLSFEFLSQFLCHVPSHSLALAVYLSPFPPLPPSHSPSYNIPLSHPNMIHVNVYLTPILLYYTCI